MPMVRTLCSRRFATWLVVCCLGGCQSVEKASLNPIAPDAPPPTFAELMARGKNQINAAHESYYADQWKEVERAAMAMKETSAYLTKLPQVNMTEPQKAKLTQLTKEFSDAADALKAAGTAQDPNKTGSAFQRLHEVYRQLRAEQLIVAPAP
jgi:hypothetical protein